MGSFGRFRGEVLAVIHDPRFGALRSSVDQHGNVSLWEVIDRVDTPRGRADLSFEAGADGPGKAHRRQFDDVIERLDGLIVAAAPLIDAKVGEASACLSSSDPREGLEWQGARLTGRDGVFWLHFTCAYYPETMVAVEFEDSQPIGVSFED